MRKVVVLVAVLASGGLWANWLCDSLEIKGDQINIKPIYVEIIKNYCTKVTVDVTGRCHLIEFGSDGSAFIKDEHIEGVKALCSNSSCATDQNSPACAKKAEELSWFEEFLINMSKTTVNWRR